MLTGREEPGHHRPHVAVVPRPVDGPRCRRWSSASWSRAATPWCRREPTTSGSASMSAGEQSPRPPGRADTGRALVCGGWPTPPPQTGRSSRPYDGRSPLRGPGRRHPAAAYMKSAMPYHGLPAPRPVPSCGLLRDCRLAGQWEATVRPSGTSHPPQECTPRRGRARPPRHGGRPRRPRPLVATWSSPGRGGTSSTTWPPTWSVTCCGHHRPARDPGDPRVGDRRGPLAAAYGRDLPGRPQGRHRRGSSLRVADREPTSATRRSGCARRSVGRCASMRGPTRTGCAPRWTGSASGSPACPGGRRSSTIGSAIALPA